MIWLTWRQHRREALVFAVFVAAIASYLIATGLVMYGAYNQITNGTSVALCQQHQSSTEFCDQITNAFYNTYFSTKLGLAGLLLLPPLVGMFLGAPLVAREMERGTFRLIWMQSVTRRRWLVAKFGMVVGGALLISAVFIPLFHWWSTPTEPNDNVIGTPLLALGGILPLAYMAFALALGVAAGTLLRRTVPAMFATLLGYTAVALAIYAWVRPHLLSPRSVTWDPYLSDIQSPATSHDWILYNGYISRTGQHLDIPALVQTCGSIEIDMRPGTAFTSCLHVHGVFSTIIWQPADRYWAFQSIEGTILFTLALALFALTLWLVRRIA